MEKFKDINDLTGAVIGAAIEDHKVIGFELLESTYEVCLWREFELRKMPFEKQKELHVEYEGVKLDCGYRLDIISLLLDRRLPIQQKNSTSALSVPPW